MSKRIQNQLTIALAAALGSALDTPGCMTSVLIDSHSFDAPIPLDPTVYLRCVARHVWFLPTC